ncbi:hypothetical protein QBC40DRAFT_162449 [Triangularia verruculosa]|uniref:Uncharacterized protein n=1 Tax=Triangularia verruculosa TaxID=2587418 RepID=A0AAN6XRZ7_9PEZI|nr:hypothetical protein QBC40DRAFT_162449 [Triangularia verruculosa]
MASPPPPLPSDDTMGIVDVVGSPPGDDIRCCCGREDCVYLRHNCSVLLSVERDVHAAAKMGQTAQAQEPDPELELELGLYFPSQTLTWSLQTLLVRHEAYMASAERDRAELNARIEQLEAENAELERKNREVNHDNHNLRDELDHLNDTVKDADTKIEFLERTLRDAQREVRRLENAAERAASLERQIAMLEEEQVTLQNTVVTTKDEARTAMHRWKQAEKGLSDLQVQLERMEKEAREDRERHVEVISRMERQRHMEKELNTAAGRLKGAAAVRSMTDSKNGGNVVSHFVRDLLQDNANLQLGMAELREMLVSSNDEIQMLREQLLFHQPAPPSETEKEPETPREEEPTLPHLGTSPQSLRAELERQEQPTSPPPAAPPPRVSQQLHIHHHYHVTHKQELKRMRKKRQGITSGTFTPPKMFSAPSSPVTSTIMWHRGPANGNHEPPTPSERQWSQHDDENPSEFGMSSEISSPRSNNRNSVFDRMVDVSYPTSPTTSLDPTSPAWKNAHRKRTSEWSTRSIGTAMFPVDAASTWNGPPQANRHPLTKFVRCGERSPSSPRHVQDDGIQAYSDAGNTDVGDLISNHHFDSRVLQRPGGRLHRVTSEESIMSLSNGMDIHTLQARPSQLALRPLGLSAAGTNVSEVVASPTLTRGSRDGRRGSVVLRDNLANQLPLFKSSQPAGRTVSTPARSSGGGDASIRRTPSALGRLVSWRPWGGAATAPVSPEPPRTPGTRPTLITTTTTAVPAFGLAVSSPTVSVSSAPKSPEGSVSSGGTFRTPGINQKGVIPGFNAYWAAHQVLRRPRSKVSLEGERLGAVEEGIREALEPLAE